MSEKKKFNRMEHDEAVQCDFNNLEITLNSGNTRIDQIQNSHTEDINIYVESINKLKAEIFNSMHIPEIKLASPIRVQLKRTKGYKLPDNTVCVNRGTKWGNPYKIVPRYGWYRIELRGNLVGSVSTSQNEAHKVSVDMYKKYIDILIRDKRVDISLLRGKNLACFCSADLPCHADYLLKLSND